MRVLVTGGRDLSLEDSRRLIHALDVLHQADNPVTRIIEGGSRGADSVARGWARRNSVPCTSLYADWGRYKKAAGPIRNEKMLFDEHPDIVIAAPGNTGTLDCVRGAKALRIPILLLPEE